jgi:hypothetical protein
MKKGDDKTTREEKAEKGAQQTRLYTEKEREKKKKMVD